MSILRSAWSPIGEWFIKVCILPTFVIALIGLLISLVGLLLFLTGVGAPVTALIETIVFVIEMITLVLLGAGIFIVGYVFVSDMWANFLGNLWTGGPSGAWTGLKADVTLAGNAFVAGAKKALVPVQSWWKAFRKATGF